MKGRPEAVAANRRRRTGRDSRRKRVVTVGGGKSSKMGRDSRKWVGENGRDEAAVGENGSENG